MRNRAVGAVLRSIRMLLDVGTSAGQSDSQLLERYLLRGDDAAEAAFRALVERHGPMVLRVCRGILDDAHDAEDAFQATFLVLARKAGTIRKGDSVASWLFGVARRVAVRADGRRKRRATHEAPGEAIIATAEAPPSDGPSGPIPEVVEEVDRLPERYRVPVVLCYFEGLTQEEAAIRLRLPASTVRVRLMRARARLRDRLVRRGLAPAAAALRVEMAREASAAMPAALIKQSVRFVTSPPAAGTVSVAITALAEGVIQMMWLARLKPLVAVAATLIVATVGVAVQGRQQPSPEGVREQARNTPPRQPARAARPCRTWRPTGLLPGSNSP